MRVPRWIIGSVLCLVGGSALILAPCRSRGGLDSVLPVPQDPMLAEAPLASEEDRVANTQVLGSDGATVVIRPSGMGFVTVAAASGPATGAPGTQILLAGSSITVTGTGAVAQGSRVLIRAGGTYSIHGTLDDGQIVVDSLDKNPVTLVLNGVRITCSTSSPIYVAQAKVVVITLAAGTENVLTDGSSYVFETPGTDEPNAALFSKDDLVITGTGSLTVNANYNNGIQSKDDLTIAGGTITVVAVNDGIKGRDSITVEEGTITIRAGGDGMQSTNNVDLERGTITITSGTIRITADEDGIQAATGLLVSGGTIEVLCGGGSTNSAGRNPGMTMGSPARVTAPATILPSAKGLKAGVELTITGGTITVDSADDALHSNGTLTVSGGILTLSSGDDAIHADEALTVDGGTIRITTSYEGLESKVITINAGEIHIMSRDDGINAASGGGTFPMMGRPGMGITAPATNWLYITGGHIVIYSGGDGLDINGSIVMTGGIVLIHGPTVNMESAIDYDRSFTMSGGFLVAVGSGGMAQAPSASSTVNSVMMTFSAVQPAGSLVHIAAVDGSAVVTFASAKAYQSVVVASPLLKDGATYTIYSGGRSTGTPADGLYLEGAYTPGTQVAQFGVAGRVTYAGVAPGRSRW